MEFSHWMSYLTAMYRTLLTILLLGTLLSCSDASKTETFASLLKDQPSIAGKIAYLASPYVTAGNRAYLVGNQDGSFPELGWHITGEMGGLWDHPIKLMDGFSAQLIWDDGPQALDRAHSFVNYPMANEHVYTLPDHNLEVERWQFAPDDQEGIVVQYLFKNNGDAKAEFTFGLTGNSDLRPTWLADSLHITDGKDMGVYDADIQAWKVKDSLNPWHLVFGANAKPRAYGDAKNNYAGQGIAKVLEYPISVAAHKTQTLQLVFAGSYTTGDEAVATYKTLQQNASQLLTDKRDRYDALAAQSKLSIPDSSLQQVFQWLKYSSDWVVRKVPEVGTGIGAGLPDYPWWFGADSEYALQGYLAVGQQQIALQTALLLDSLSEARNGNGKIVHEVSTNGVVFNPGNLNETPQFASLIWTIYQWTGDTDFLKKHFPTVKKGLQWLLNANDADHNLLPDGFGMMEIHGMDSEMIDVAAYTQKAFADAALMAKALGKNALASEYEKVAAALKEKINTEFWSDPFGSYADFMGTDQQALKLIDDALVRADTLQKPWSVAELKEIKQTILQHPSNKTRPFVVHHNWVVNTPMETGIADSTKAIRALQTAEQFSNPFGMFVTGIDRDESAGTDAGSFKGSKIFSYTGAVMTLPTGVQAVAENNYGRPNEALTFLKKMERTFSFALPGSMYEVSPDYGMFTQAWNIYGFAVPIVQQFFGIRPQAQNKKVIIAPIMPSAWDQASLEQVKVGNNSVSVHYKKVASKLEVSLSQTQPDWTLELILPKTMDDHGTTVQESTVEAASLGNQWHFTTTENTLKVILSKP